ncbi:MAG: hypothetical protein WC030_02875 [Candidatus Paceibacterota bacterium]
MKRLFLGVVLIVLVGLGGFFYRNALEYSARPIACPVETFSCPDGTQLPHMGLSCSFPACPPPNVSVPSLDIAFALPPGVSEVTPSDASVEAAYETPTVSATEVGTILIRRYAVSASSTALATIQETAINLTSGMPASVTQFTSADLGTRHFTVVTVDRFEGQVNVAYYLARTSDVLRFDAIDRGVDWMNPDLDVSALPAQAALRSMLGTLQGR